MNFISPNNIRNFGKLAYTKILSIALNLDEFYEKQK